MFSKVTDLQGCHESSSRRLVASTPIPGSTGSPRLWLEKVYAHAHGHVGITLQRVDSTDLAFAGAAEQARLLAAGSITAPALPDLYLERIARLDPELRAYRIVLADSARREADAAQARLDAGELLPLLGVPIAIKDDVDVAGEVTTYGSGADGPAKTEDAEVVRRLRAAGVVIVWARPRFRS